MTSEDFLNFPRDSYRKLGKGITISDENLKSFTVFLFFSTMMKALPNAVRQEKDMKACKLGRKGQIKVPLFTDSIIVLPEQVSKDSTWV